MAVQDELLARLVPWHELGALRVDDGFFRWLAGGLRVHIEANHAADHVHTNLLLPELGWSRERNLDTALTLRRVQLEHKLGVSDPSEFLALLLESFVVEMAAAARLVSPLTLQDYILGLFEHLDLDELRREDYKRKI